MAGHETIFVVTGSSEVLSSNQNADFLHLVDNDFAEDDGASEYGDSNFQSSGTPAPHFAESERVICITTHHIAKDVSNGFLFGRSADCDIRLGSVFHGTPVRLHPSNESILLRGSRAFDHGHTVEILIGDEVRLGIRCLRAPASWNAYCAELRTMLPGLGPLNFAPNIQSTNASGRRPVYTCRRPLTEGSNSQVQEAIEKYNARLYAVKVYKRSAKARGQEPELLQMLQHPNIVGFVSYDRPGNKEPATLVMELVQGDTLEALLDSHNTNNRLSQSGVRGVLHQMVHALSYMHGQGITHRDLRPANVMVLARRTPICIKLIDFVQATTAHQFSDYTGRSLYTAPEIVAGQVCTDKVDLFSVGMMALQMIFGLPRAPRALPAEWLQAVFARACFLSIEYPFSVPVNFVCSLLREDPNSRPSALQALGDLFFVPGNNIETPVALIDADFADTPNNLHQEVLLPIDDNEVQQPPEQQQAPLPGHYNAVPENDNDGNAPDAAAEQPEQSSRPPTPITPHAPDAPRVFINGHEINTHGFPGHVNVQEICALVPPAQRRECLVLCARLRVREVIVLNMRPLLDFAGLPSSVLDSNHLLLSAPLPSQFEVLWWRGVSIVYAPADGMVHVKQLFDFYGNYIHTHPSSKNWLKGAA
ncbi:hypothetical protein SEUCBS140593_001061 [Sporothrix eucalyptigena]|uniref:EKC/KEOPS complex subunit BUD32 n=1 Tax=Sporothrix eucalyptigena TaxID=1812306 RepID=A0ABP0AV14_9PEZI